MHFLFLIASLGVVNGVITGIYLLTKKSRSISETYFAGLILVLCIRIGKSVLYYFFPETDRLILQIGLSACIFIGPFFYLYLKSLRQNEKVFKKADLGILIILGLSITATGILFPYRTRPEYWNPEIVQVIYLVWAAFFLLGFIELYRLLKTDLFRINKLKGEKKYLVIVVLGVLLITITYQLALHIQFTYIWGAFIFSFFFYVLGIRALIKGKSVAPRPSLKRLANGDNILEDLNALMKEEKVFRNQHLKLEDVSSKLDVPRHILSQVLNENYPSGYTSFIHGYRIAEAQQLIKNRPDLSLEGIGYEAGFKSKSVFFEVFKKTVGRTPASYKKMIEGDLSGK